MDWEPTQAVRLSAAALGPRGGGPPKVQIPGVSEATIRDRLRRRICLRCGQSGHRHRECQNAVNRGTPRDHGRGARPRVFRGKPAPGDDAQENDPGTTEPSSDEDDID